MFEDEASIYLDSRVFLIRSVIWRVNIYHKNIPLERGIFISHVGDYLRDREWIGVCLSLFGRIARRFLFRDPSAALFTLRASSNV